MKFVFLIVQLLKDVLLSIDTSLYLLIKSSLLIVKVSSNYQNGFITFNNTILDFLMNALFYFVHAVLGYPELVAVVLLHQANLFFELLLELAKLELKLRSESFESVLNAFDFSICEVFVCLDFAINVLELGLELFLRLNTLPQHNIVVMVHLGQLMLHFLNLLVIILIFCEVSHIFLDKLRAWRPSIYFQR
jgi:hypothetical protein